MFKRKPRSKNTFLLLRSSDRGSDIVKPDNTSLIVNESDTETDGSPKELISALSEEDDVSDDGFRKSSSLMLSLTQKTQSTPRCRISSFEVGGKLSQNSSKNRQTQTSRESNGNNKIYLRSESQEIPFFLDIIKSCGATRMSGRSSSYSMSEDQAIFSIKLNNKLKNEDVTIQKFLFSLEKEMENLDDFEKMLACTLTEEDCQVARGPIQESLIRILLNVECLQAGLFEILLKKLASIVVENDSGSEHQLVSLVLRQIRFLNKTKDIKVVSKLFEIIQVAPISIQREIIFMLPEIITEEEVEEASLQLLDLLRSDSKLTHVIVDSIGNLPLSQTSRNLIQARLICRIDKCQLEFLPSLVQFILSRCDPEELTVVITGLREKLPFSKHHIEILETEFVSNSSKNEKRKPEEDSYIKLTFENLKFSAMASKQVADIWIKVISDVNSPADFRIVDLIMLIILHSCLIGKKSQILSLLKHKIKSGIITEAHVHNTFEVLFVVILEYFSTIMEFASAFVKSFEQVIIDFGAYLYEECFAHNNFFMEQTVVSEIVVHVGTGVPGITNTALRVLKSLSENHKDVLCKHVVSVMTLLIKLNDTELCDVRLLTDVIADLVYCRSVSDNMGWQDELQMFIRKQLSSSKLDQCKKGIVAAIMLGKHAAKATAENEFDYADTDSLLEMAMDFNGNCDIKKSFFNDEFATMVRASNLNKSFRDTWSEKTFTTVTNNLFVRNIEIECEFFPMSLQFSLDGTNSGQMVFPVVDFILNSISTKRLNIPVSSIPSTLRLLWSCESNLNKITPVFSASVIMPEVTVFDKLVLFEEHQTKLIMNCLFLCANYFIECVNAFSAQKNFNRALIRLKQLMEIRKLIKSHIHLVPDYTPPLCQFHVPVGKIMVNKKKNTTKIQKKGRKRKLDETESEMPKHAGSDSQYPEISATCSAEASGRFGEKINDSEEDLHVYKSYFREFVFDTYELLNTDLELKNPTNEILPNENHSRFDSSEKMKLHASDMLFLLENLINDSEHALKHTKRTLNWKNRSVNSGVENLTAENFIKSSIKILPNLLKKIQVLSSYCKSLLETNDGVYDGPGMYPKDGCDIKLAQASALKFISEILCWNGFQKPNNKQILRDILVIISNKGKTSDVDSRFDSFTTLALKAGDYLASFSESVLVLEGGLSIVKSFKACLEYSSSSGTFNILADLCHKLLSRPWYSVTGRLEKGAGFNQHIDFLIKTYFASVDDSLKVVQNTAKVTLNEVHLLSEKDSVMNTMKTVNKGNFPLLYRTMCEALVSASADELSKVQNDDQGSLEIWNSIVEILMVLVEIVKSNSSRINLASLLKRSQSMIQLFLSKGMPIVESALRVKSMEVLKLLKSFQTVTRFLHSICCHSKINSDSMVAAHVPTIRSLCERLTLEVKGMLILNKIPMDCITIAILKNRDLKGNDILSQETMDDESEDGSDLPPEETGEEDDDGDKDGDSETKETQESN